MNHLTAPNMSTNHSQAYLKFLNLVKAIRDLPTFPTLDAVEQTLLESFAAVWHTGKQITVLEAMHMSKEISPSTVHRRLKTLRAKGMIMLINDTTDSRTKYVMPTPLANQFFDQLGQCMDSARTA